MTRRRAYHKVLSNAREVQDFLNILLIEKGTLLQIVYTNPSYVVFYEGYRRIQ